MQALPPSDRASTIPPTAAPPVARGLAPSPPQAINPPASIDPDSMEQIAPMPDALRQVASPPAIAKSQPSTFSHATNRPLSPEQHRAISDASKQRFAIDKALGVAGFNAWSCAALAACSLLGALFDPSSLIIAGGLAVVAINEFKGRRQLRSLLPESLTRLMWNQLFFAALLIGYSAYQIINTATSPGRYDAYMDDPQLARMLGPIGDIHTNITYAVYASLIPISLVIQGSTAWYYRRKRSKLQAFLNETPPWVLELHQPHHQPLAA